MEVAIEKGILIKIDEEDLEIIKGHKWYPYLNKNKTAYMIFAWVKQKKYPLHQALIGKKEGYKIGFVNGDCLDFRKSNLKHYKQREIATKTRGRRGSSSRYKGVSWIKSRGKWSATIQKEGETQHIGYYDFEEEAAKAYNQRAKELFGENCYLNVLYEDNNTRIIGGSYEYNR